jgi:hypothetical protein
MYACMATKTISIDLEAYEKMKRVQRHSRESFSTIIKRAEWPAPKHTGAALKAALAGLPVLDEAILDSLDADQKSDSPPDDPWNQT